MLNYLIRRLLIGLVTLLCVTFLVYGLIRQMPGDIVTVVGSESDPSRGADDAYAAKLRAQYHLDEPFPVGYWYWLQDILRGDLGYSRYQKQSVARSIGARIGPTLLISLTSLTVAWFLAVPIGLYASARNGRFDERVTSTLLYTLYSFPAFVAALFLQYHFYLKLGWLPLDGMHSRDYAMLTPWGQFRDLVWHSILPVACYTYGSLAYDSRFIRANMAEVLRQDYVRTAQAKGCGPIRVLLKHAFRNTLIPMITLIGLLVPTLLSGAVVLESIFSWPGMGRLFLEAIYARDIPLIMGLTFLFSLLTLAGTLLSDLLYAVVDPRVSHS